jgi:flagellar motor switch protein FliM
MATRPFHPKQAATPARGAASAPYDFRRPDRIPADQLKAMQSLHENFAHVLGSSLSAYLRTFVSVELSRIEQVSFSEFSSRAARPLTLVALRMRPHEAAALLQLSHSIVFPVLEILLGGTGKSTAAVERDITEIERSILNPILRILVQELKSVWQPLTPVEFALEEDAAARQIVSSTAPNLELLAVAFEARIGDAPGVLHLGIPSRVIRAAVVQSGFISQQDPAPPDAAKMLRLIERAQLNAEIRLNGPRMLFEDLLNIEPGDVLTFDHPLGREVDLELNGTTRFKGHVVAAGNRRGFQVKRECPRQEARPNP